MRVVVLGAAAALLVSSSAIAAEPSLQDRVSSFLNVYAGGDRVQMEAALDPDVHLYGSDVAETYSGLNGFEHMIDDDMKLWSGAAKFGPMSDVSTVRGGDLETIFFDVPFTLGAHPSVPVRFAMVWRLDDGRWKLVQSSNVVPTVGQSADLILRPPAAHSEK